MKLFLDATILFSAALPKSRVGALVQVAISHGIECVTNEHAFIEAERNLARKAASALRQLRRLRKQLGNTAVSQPPGKVSLKEKDLPVLGGAIAGECSHLLTGDSRDFGHLFGKVVQGVKVVSPRMLAEEFVQMGILEKAKRV